MGCLPCSSYALIAKGVLLGTLLIGKDSTKTVLMLRSPAASLLALPQPECTGAPDQHHQPRGILY